MLGDQWPHLSHLIGGTRSGEVKRDSWALMNLGRFRSGKLRLSLLEKELKSEQPSQM